MTPSFILSVARQVASAVMYLHEQGVIHGLLKSKNVLLDRDNVAFVSIKQRVFKMKEPLLN